MQVTSRTPEPEAKSGRATMRLPIGVGEVSTTQVQLRDFLHRQGFGYALDLADPTGER
jgi:hypothetical protein